MGADPTTVWHWAGRALIRHLETVDDSVGRAFPEGWLALSPLPHPDMNMAYVGTDETDSEAAAMRVVDVVQAARTQHVPLLLLLAPALVDHCSGVLSESGLHPAGTIPLMLLQVDEATPSAAPDSLFSVHRVTTTDDLETSCRLMAEAFGLPEADMRAYISPRILERPETDVLLTTRDGLSVSAVLTSRVDDALGVRFMATPAAYQRQGAGLATLHALIERHRQRGGRSIFLGTTPAGERLYTRAGFRTIEQTPVWLALP